VILYFPCSFLFFLHFSFFVTIQTHGVTLEKQFYFSENPENPEKVYFRKYIINNIHWYFIFDKTSFFTILHLNQVTTKKYFLDDNNAFKQIEFRKPIMVKKGCAKGAQKIGAGYTALLHSYPDKIAITNLLCRGFIKQLKGGYIK
jgi:hypothetical protein